MRLHRKYYSSFAIVNEIQTRKWCLNSRASEIPKSKSKMNCKCMFFGVKSTTSTSKTNQMVHDLRIRYSLFRNLQIKKIVCVCVSFVGKKTDLRPK